MHPTKLIKYLGNFQTELDIVVLIMVRIYHSRVSSGAEGHFPRTVGKTTGYVALITHTCIGKQLFCSILYF